jgi:predicted 3-demethylubiquinone-9 3-methyltransferase (glyoxalase superfamily)
MPQIMPFLWFATEAEDAVKFYVSTIKNSKIENVSRYTDAGPGPTGSAMTVEFTLDGQDMMALNGGEPASSPGQPPISLLANCDTQDEVDALWDKLSEGGRKLPCGWLVDKFGIAWNIVPKGIGELLGSADVERQQRAMKAMLQMEKLDINELRRAYEGVKS